MAEAHRLIHGNHGGMRQYGQPCLSRDYFNPALLETGRSGQQPVDLSVFENGNQVPGKYRVDIWVNDMLMETRDVRFVIKPGGDDKAGLQPCLTGRIYNGSG